MFFFIILPETILIIFSVVWLIRTQVGNRQRFTSWGPFPCTFYCIIPCSKPPIWMINKNNKFNSNYAGGSKLELMFLINWQSFLNFYNHPSHQQQSDVLILVLYGFIVQSILSSLLLLCYNLMIMNDYE
jgi:hypothetical protein